MNTTRLDSSSDGWLLLANAILEDYMEQYAELFPKCANTQQEYTNRDITYFLPRREKLMYHLVRSPIRHIVDVDVCRRAFEQAREARKKELEIEWVG